MSKTLFKGFFLFLFLGFLALECTLTADTDAATGGAGSSSITRPPLKASEEQYRAPPPIAPRGPAAKTLVIPSFTRPGIIGLIGGAWVGTDHLYGLTHNVGLIGEIIKPNTLTLTITEQSLEKRVEDIFSKGGIVPEFKPTAGDPLPLFHIIVMFIQIPDGVGAYCAGRLFESVKLDRVNLNNKVYFQAITWEDQSLVIASAEQIQEKVDSAVDEIATNFLNRYRFYLNLKVQNETPQ